MFNATIKGRLGSDSEMRYTKEGTSVVNFSIAHNWLYHDERLVKWIRCFVWGEAAEMYTFSMHTLGLLASIFLGRWSFSNLTIS